MNKFLERGYPYIGGIVTCVLSGKFKIKLSGSAGIDNALNGIITMASLIICFLGAIIPLIVSARTDSKVVKNAFKLDTDGLLLKYIKETVYIGLVLVMVCVVTYFRDNFPNNISQSFLLYVDISVLVIFLLCTFRSYTFIFKLLKLEDLEFRKQDTNSKTEYNKELDKILKNSQKPDTE